VSIPQPVGFLGSDLTSCLELTHEVSIRSTYNRMDAHNLALVLTPNLVKSLNFKRDLEMCAVPGGPGMGAQFNGQVAKPTSVTLGLVIKICISYYYEIFDEVIDRTEAIPPQLSSSSFTVIDSNEPTSATASSFSSDISGTQVDGDDESIDDQMLVMPIGPTSPGTPGNRSNGFSPTPPSAWSSHMPTPTSYKPRQRKVLSKSSNQSLHTSPGSGVGGNLQGTVGKAKSMINIEKGTIGGGPGGRKGSISIGRGTTSKGTGSGVEAIGITANGFFSPPEGVPPVPSRRR